mmetsp:Transcript_69165/g.160334  ORF Transcript_69165/g.160334 Transcript_69165/m.160334 type:complete len:304 (-) Transcript_69165:26-937(-)
MPDGGQDLIYFATARIDIQAQRRHHVTHRLDGSIQIVVGLLPRNIVDLRVKLGIHLVLQVDDVLSEVFLLLLHLLERVGHVLHPRIMVLECFLDVANVQAHGGDLRRHGSLHTLAARDNGVGGIDSGAHLVEVNVHRVHGSSEILHVPLASQHNSPDVVHLTLVVAEEVLKFTDVIFQLVQILCHRVHTSRGASGVERLHGRRSTVHMRQLLVEVALHVGELRLQLRLKVLEPRRDLLQNLRVAGTGLPGRDEAVVCSPGASITRTALQALNTALEGPDRLLQSLHQAKGRAFRSGVPRKAGS